MKSLSCVRLVATPWTAVYQSPPSMRFSRQEDWSGKSISFSRRSSQPRDRTWVSLIVDRRFTVWATREVLDIPNCFSSYKLHEIYIFWAIFLFYIVQFSSVQFSRSGVSNSLRPHESQHSRPPCPSPTPRVYVSYTQTA